LISCLYFRYIFAVKAILSGVPINIHQKWLSNSSIFITSIYTDVTGIDTRQYVSKIRLIKAIKLIKKEN